MLDYYDIKLSSYLEEIHFYNLLRQDIPIRETYRFDYLCKLYKLELTGEGRYIVKISIKGDALPTALEVFKINGEVLLLALGRFEQETDNLKYRDYLYNLLEVEYNA